MRSITTCTCVRLLRRRRAAVSFPAGRRQPVGGRCQLSDRALRRISDHRRPAQDLGVALRYPAARPAGAGSLSSARNGTAPRATAPSSGTCRRISRAAISALLADLNAQGVSVVILGDTIKTPDVARLAGLRYVSDYKALRSGHLRLRPLHYPRPLVGREKELLANVGYSYDGLKVVPKEAKVIWRGAEQLRSSRLWKAPGRGRVAWLGVERTVAQLQNQLVRDLLKRTSGVGPRLCRLRGIRSGPDSVHGRLGHIRQNIPFLLALQDSHGRGDAQRLDRAAPEAPRGDGHERRSPGMWTARRGAS